ncbi:MAG TPA: tetraacyldisaccharide 4'-kinase [Rhizomicrobium sp.]
MRPPDFWTRADPVSQLVVGLLTPLGWLYGWSVQYRATHALPYQAAAKVVCVGNLTAGGTGKTPIAIAVARALTARGARPVFLTRGYGGRIRGPAFVAADDRATHVGDEPLLLAAVAPVIISADRAAGARLAEEHGFDVIVMDDGHQNFSLHKDLSLVVVDAETGFGNNRVLPAGPLREPVGQGLKRADAVILSGSGSPVLAGFAGPVVHARLVEDPHLLADGARVVAFAGIGRPAKFFASLETLGVEIVDRRAYGDHHVYTQAEIARLKARARATKSVLVTTEKDFARLTPAEREGIVALPVRTEFAERDVFDRLLDSIVRRGLPPKAS